MTQADTWLQEFTAWHFDREILAKREDDPEENVQDNEWMDLHERAVDLLYRAQDVVIALRP